MITATFVLGIIFVTMSITAITFCVILSLTSRNASWLLAWLPGIVFTVCGIAMVAKTPSESDVLNGKAHYVEVYHTYDNDTIKTYHLDWNKKTN